MSRLEELRAIKEEGRAYAYDSSLPWQPYSGQGLAARVWQEGRKEGLDERIRAKGGQPIPHDRAEAVAAMRARGVEPE